MQKIIKSHRQCQKTPEKFAPDKIWAERNFKIYELKKIKNRPVLKDVGSIKKDPLKEHKLIWARIAVPNVIKSLISMNLPIGIQFEEELM